MKTAHSTLSLTQISLKHVVAFVAGLAALIISSKIQIPFWPIPMSMQVAVVFSLGLLGGGRYAFLTLMAFLTIGAAGFPVFANSPERGLGLAYILGPSGGYLIGFVIAGTLIGYMRNLSLYKVILGAIALLLLIYFIGTLWLSLYVPANQLLYVGVFPFVLSDFLKLTLAIGLWSGVKNIKVRSQ